MKIRKGHLEVKLVSFGFFPLLSAFPQIITSPSKVVASIRFLYISESNIFLDLDHFTSISDKVVKKN